MHSILVPILLASLGTGAQVADTREMAVASACAEGYRLYTRQEYARAEEHLKEAIAGSEAGGTTDSVRASCLIQLAATERKERKYAEAEATARRGVDLFEKESPASRIQLGISLDILADILEDEEKYSEAIPFVERSWSLETGHKPGQPIAYRDTRFVRKIGLLSLKNKEYDRAEALLQQNLAASDRPEIKYHGQTVPALNDLAAVYIAQSRWTNAEPLLRRALALADQWSAEVAQEDLLATLDQYAGLMHKTNREGEAEGFASRARSIRERASTTQ